jgi:hypothetical protein
MYKDKEVNKNVKNIFLSMCDVKVSDIYFTEFGAVLTTVLPVLFKYCYKWVIFKKMKTFSDEDDVSGNQNNCYWPLHNVSILRCKHHMQEKLVYCCTYLENL